MDDEYSTIGDKREVGFIDVPSVTTSSPSEEGPVMVSEPFPFAGGKPQSVPMNEVAVASFTIENTTNEYILLWGVKIYASIPEDSFVLSLMKPPSGQPDDIPVEDFVPCFDMEERNLNPHGSLTIWMSCVPKEIGLFTSILHIQTDEGIIERLVFLLAEDEVSKALAPQRPYNIPTQIRKAIEFEEIPEVVLQGLTEENYVSYFIELLGMEEFLMMEYVKAYNIKFVTLRQRYNVRLVALKVSGLGERRPSVVSGDVVNVYGEYSLHQGLIDRVEADELLLQFNDEFYQRHIDSNVYEICFVFNGTNFCKLHEAILSAEALHENFLFPHEYQSKRRITTNNFVPISLLLDEEQQNVVRLILGYRGGAPYVILGPPGTGKTKTLVEVILQLYTTRRDSHILVCAYSNCAADHILEKILCECPSLREEDIYRLNATHRPLQKISALLRLCTYSAGFFTCPSRGALRKYKIIITTYTSSSYLYHDDRVNRGHFSHIILDDASQVSEPETMIPISTLIEKNTINVLCGDPKQLGPEIFSKQADAYGLGRSFPERLLDFEVYRSGDHNYVTILLSNYRSHPAIVNVPSRLFYSGALRPDREDIKTCFLPWADMLPNRNFPLIFCGIQGFDEREKGSLSWFNRIEDSKVVELVQRLIRRNVPEQDIGIITPFPQQVLKIRKALMSLRMRHIEIGGVEQFLGEEKEVIIMSTVRSTANHDEYDRTFRMGYLSNPKRLNFALTRARSLLIIVGNPYILEKVIPVKKVELVIVVGH